MDKRKIKLSRNAFAMHNEPVLTDFPCSVISAFYAAFATGLVGWCLISTAGWELITGILAIHIIPAILLCRFKAPPSRLLNPFSRGGEFQKPASAGGRIGAEGTTSTPKETNNTKERTT